MLHRLSLGKSLHATTRVSPFPRGVSSWPSPRLPIGAPCLYRGPQPPRPRSSLLVLRDFEETGENKGGSGGMDVLAWPRPRAPHHVHSCTYDSACGFRQNYEHRIKRSTRSMVAEVGTNPNLASTKNSHEVVRGGLGDQELRKSGWDLRRVWNNTRIWADIGSVSWCKAKRTPLLF